MYTNSRAVVHVTSQKLLKRLFSYQPLYFLIVSKYCNHKYKFYANIHGATMKEFEAV
jgi:hypothetical protein